jgi:cell wall assembly regulator SMI1
LRSESAARLNQTDGFELQSPNGEIPMQSFEGGAPPPPPVAHSWRKIDAWADEHYPELFDQLCEGATNNDLNELEHQLDCSLPQDVRDSLMIHDGQERGGTPTGIIFSGMLLDCEEMVQEWENWRKVNQEILLETTVTKPAMPSKALGGSSQASSSKAPPSPAAPNNANWRADLMAKQDCIPHNAIQKAYAHPAWIPLVRDWGGNNLAVDLAPGPAGKWGQIILFGRDYDTKYVVARSWSAFLALVADDLKSGKWFVDEDSGELKLREFRASRVEPAYFDILRWRMDQKYGRRVQKRRPPPPTNGAASPARSASPYGNGLDGSAESRGRTQQRVPGSSPLASPIRPGTGGAFGRSSPLARVTEETPVLPSLQTSGIKPPKLVEVDTPKPGGNESPQLSALAGRERRESKGKENADPVLRSIKANGKQPMRSSIEESMKTIEI